VTGARFCTTNNAKHDGVGETQNYALPGTPNLPWLANTCNYYLSWSLSNSKLSGQYLHLKITIFNENNVYVNNRLFCTGVH